MAKEKTNIYEKLSIIQRKLSVPKGQMNTFGGYKFRSNEDILKAVTPLLMEYGVMILTKDGLVNIGDRYYIKATQTLRDIETGEEYTTEAFARESLIKKGMDESQITGTASSYARKYALNALFNIDDTKDADTNEFQKNTTPVAPKLTPYQKIANSIGEAKDSEALDKIIAWLGENTKSFTESELEKLQHLIDDKKEGLGK